VHCKFKSTHMLGGPSNVGCSGARNQCPLYLEWIVKDLNVTLGYAGSMSEYLPPKDRIVASGVLGSNPCTECHLLDVFLRVDIILVEDFTVPLGYAGSMSEYLPPKDKIVASGVMGSNHCTECHLLDV
jgi:hypothetical protein